MLVVFAFYFVLTCSILCLLAWRFPVKAEKLLHKITQKRTLQPSDEYAYLVIKNGDYSLVTSGFTHNPQLQKIYPVSLASMHIFIENKEMGISVDFEIARTKNIDSVKQMYLIDKELLTSDQALHDLLKAKFSEHVKTAEKNGNRLEDIDLEIIDVLTVSKTIIASS